MKYGLIGEKLGHSLSKKIYEKCGLEYTLLEISRDNLPKLLQNKTLTAFNVTIPYKREIIDLLDFVSPEALSIGAVNTVFFNDNKWCGYNTDIYGMELAFNKANIKVKDKNVMILGTGGTSNTAYYLAKKLGANSIVKVSRSGKINYDNCYDLVDTNVIINTTPVGMYPNNQLESIDLTKFSNLTGVFDAIYNPLRTNLILQAKSLNIACSGGLYMLVGQALKSMSIFNGIDVDLVLLDKIYNELLLEFSNIVLIGMPSCGKTTIGKRLAEKLNKTFVDVDELFFRYYKTTSATEIIMNGEDSFREKETTVIRSIKEGGKVIATGGGSILREENIKIFKQNGIMVYIDRDINKLSVSGRPLSVQAGVRELYRVRKPLYEKYADFTVVNDDLDNVVREVIIEYEKNIDN